MRRTGRRRGVRALLAAAGAAVAVIFVAAGPASAHATLESTSPAQGAVLSTEPTGVSLTFDESVGVGADSIRVFSPAGRRVDDGRAAVTANPDTVAVGLRPGLGDGTYTVAWHVVSDDSHPIEGAYVFSIGAASSTQVDQATINVSSSRAVGVFYGSLRWLGYLGYALLFGGFVFLALCWPAGAADARAVRMLAIGWTASLASAIGVLVVQGAYAGELPLGDALDGSVLSGTLGTRFGQAVLARLILLALVAPLLAATLGRLPAATARGRALFLGAAGLLGLAGASTWAAADHASTGIQVPLAVFSDLVHLDAMGLWLGGLALLALAACRPAAGTAAEDLVPAVRRFSRLALCCVGALVASGVYQAWRGVGSWTALSATPYGRLVVLKIGGICVLIGLGWMARDWIRRAVEHTGTSAVPQAQRIDAHGLLLRLRRSVALEAGVAVIVLVFSSVLVAAQPGRSAEAAASGPTQVNLSFDTGRVSGTLSVFLSPGKVGLNQAHLYLDNGKGLPYDAAELTMRFSLPAAKVGPEQATVIHDGPGHYIDTPIALTFAGEWTLSVTIRSDDFDETTVTVPIKISP